MLSSILLDKQNRKFLALKFSANQSVRRDELDEYNRFVREYQSEISRHNIYDVNSDRAYVKVARRDIAKIRLLEE